MFARNWNIDFMKGRKVSALVSIVLIVASLGLLVTRGLNLGIDFQGGILMQLEFPSRVSVDEMRTLLGDVGQEGAQIQAYSDRGILIRLQSHQGEVREQTLAAIRTQHPDVDVLRLEKVGPVVGEQLRNEALLAVAIALIGILAYITVRFRFRFAVSSVLALLHDTIITLGVFSLTWREISLPFIAAILTIVGYSLNDTIVVLDRVRENWRFLRNWGIAPLLNTSINQMLSRTINTSLTTFLPVLAFFIWGGPVIANFSFALLVGIVVGTYSSIYISGGVLCAWYERSPER
ncbi:MAG: protein translocase subunit SecF [Synergistales bacterium]|nr:protein translocase subunit SecF [Synergistales bacterium]